MGKRGRLSPPSPLTMNKNEYSVRPISYGEAKEIILKHHYSHKMAQTMYSFGLFHGEELVGAITYGMPASPNVGISICGRENKQYVIELNRLALVYNLPNEASFLISNSTKLLPKPKIVVSYADTGKDHAGYVYQAVNWLYTGQSASGGRTYIYTSGHPRHYEKGEPKRQVISPKHRYVFFHGDRRWQKQIRKSLKYQIKKYPKGVK